MSTLRQPVPLIPKEFIRPDADVTALVGKCGHVLACVHAPNYTAVVSASDVIGMRVAELYKPFPLEAERLLERTFAGESNWAALNLPTHTDLGTLERRYVVAASPWQPINGQPVALMRMRLISDSLRDALEGIGTRADNLTERVDHLFSQETSLDDVYIDALLDLTMKETGFDLAVHLDETGTILDIFDVTKSTIRDHHPVGSNYLHFMERFDPQFVERWHWVLEHKHYFNSYETLPTSDGQLSKVISRIRVTDMKTDGGLRVLQAFLKHIESYPADADGLQPK